MCPGVRVRIRHTYGTYGHSAWGMVYSVALHTIGGVLRDPGAGAWCSMARVQGAGSGIRTVLLTYCVMGHVVRG